MRYTLEIAATNGEIVPLYMVASVMAKRDATAGGTPFHKPMYEGRLYGYIRALLEEVRSGRLKVCDGYGSPITVDPNVEATSHFGYTTRYIKEPNWKALCRKTPPINVFWEVLQKDWESLRQHDSREPDWETLRLKWERLPEAWPNSPGWKKLCRYWEQFCQAVAPVELHLNHGNWNFAHLDLGPTAPDKDRPNIAWFAKLHLLNQWADERGDSFIISHDGVGWFDERGFVSTVNQSTPDSNTRQPSKAQSIPEQWIPAAQQFGIQVSRKHPHLSLDQIATKVHDLMKKETQDGKAGMTGKGGRVPSAASIRRHALKGIKP